MGTKIVFKFADECGEVPHPVGTIGQVHESRLKPTNSCTLEVGEDEEDLLVACKDLGMVLEMEVTRD